MSENRARGARASGRRAVLKGLLGAALLPPLDPLRLAASPGQPFAPPDNLTFDSRGDLWMASDIAGDVVNDREDYRVAKNAGAFRVPTSGASRGAPGLFVSVGAPPQPAVVAIRRRT